jgi:hypothetical protein
MFLELFKDNHVKDYAKSIRSLQKIIKKTIHILISLKILVIGI